MQQNLFPSWRTNSIFLAMLAMLLALFFSRTLLSVSMMCFVALCTLHGGFGKQVKLWSTSLFLFSLSLLFFIPLLSGLWSQDNAQWLRSVRIKLPLLFLPLSFAGDWNLSKKQWRALSVAYLLLCLWGSGYSLYHYLQNKEGMHAAYLKAKVIFTPLKGDHVRFSWMISTAALLCLYFLSGTLSKGLRFLLVALLGWFAVYLHLLSVRTGLFSFYLILLFFSVRHLVQKKKTGYAIGYLFLLFLLPGLAWVFFPTFQNRIRYFIYDHSFISSHTYLPGANDGNRFLSIKGAWQNIVAHPLGVGIGDIRAVMLQWYRGHIPGMLPQDQIYPSSEWMVYGLAAGWPGFLLFTAIMAVPLLIKNVAHRFFWIVLNSIAAFSFLFDIGLEVSFGVFLYAGLVLSWYKWLYRQQNINKELFKKPPFFPLLKRK